MSELRIGCLGPAGTFSELASHDAKTRKMLQLKEQTPVTFCTTIGELIANVIDDTLQLAVVPLENSIEGSVDETLDALAQASNTVTIIMETILPIEHVLIAPYGNQLSAIEKVFSHPQPLNQCRSFLQLNLPNAQTVPCASTAEAVRLIANQDELSEHWAAIGTERAAHLHGCEILARNIADAKQNVTRFAWITNRNHLPWAGLKPSQNTLFRTSIAFSGPGDQTPGWLLTCLQVFANHSVNLTRIESRPLRHQLGHYRFFVDLEGKRSSIKLTNALSKLETCCDHVYILGSYPIVFASDSVAQR